MAIDILQEPVKPFREIARLAGNRRAGKRTHVSTLWRWATQGRKGIRLETIMCGGIRMTTEAALQRFFDRLTEQAEPQAAPAPQVSVSRQREIEAAEKRLAAAGI